MGHGRVVEQVLGGRADGLGPGAITDVRPVLGVELDVVVILEGVRQSLDLDDHPVLGDGGKIGEGLDGVLDES